MNLHLAPSLGILEVAVFEDERLPATVGGFGVAGAWSTRDLNTIRVSSGPSISLNPATSTITLLPGIYFVEGSAPAYYVDGHQTRFQNVSSNVTTMHGTSEFSANGVGQVQTRSSFRGYFQVVGTSQDFEVQHYLQVSTGPQSFGNPSGAPGTPAIYTTVSITRLR